MSNNRNNSSFPLYNNNDVLMEYSGADMDMATIKSLIKNLNEAQEIAKTGHWKLVISTNELFWSDEDL